MWWEGEKTLDVGPYHSLLEHNTVKLNGSKTLYMQKILRMGRTLYVGAEHTMCLYRAFYVASDNSECACVRARARLCVCVCVRACVRVNE